MKRRIVMVLVLTLVFVGCSRQGDQSKPGQAEKSAVGKEAVESTKEALPKEAAKAGEEDPDVNNCLQLVSQARFDDALPVCLEALKKHPSNEQVKKAVARAQAAVGDASATVTDKAQEAQEAAGKKVQGAMEEATGSMAP